jgi:hypothetical protein
VKVDSSIRMLVPAGKVLRKPRILSVAVTLEIQIATTRPDPATDMFVNPLMYIAANVILESFTRMLMGSDFTASDMSSVTAVGVGDVPVSVTRSSKMLLMARVVDVAKEPPTFEYDNA